MALSMKQLFSQHHRLSEEETASIWKECVFTLDANALLNIYRYADATRDDLIRVLDGLKDRIWISHQAAKEFYKNRIGVIKDQRKKYDDLRVGLERALNHLRGGEFTKSAFLKIAEIEEILKPAINEANTKIDDWRSKHPDLLHKDPFLEQIASIIGDSIGQEPAKAVFDENCIRAKERIAAKQPPGYMDEKKPEPDRYGDALIWFEMLDHAKAVERPIMLLTDDLKEDWWQIEGGEKLGPRPELREEMRKIAGVEFYLANPSHFLEVAGSQLKVGVSESSVENAKEVAAEVAAANLNRDQLSGEQGSSGFSWNRARLLRAERAERAVAKWVRHTFDVPTVRRTPGDLFDFEFQFGDVRIGVEVTALGGISLGGLVHRVSNRFLRAHFGISKGQVADFWLFIVVSSPEASNNAHSLLADVRFDPQYNISIGYLSSEAKYIEVARIFGDAENISPTRINEEDSDSLLDL